MPGALLGQRLGVDLDIQKFFDSVPWDLIVKAVEVNTDQPWVVLYVKRWLAAPVQRSDGSQAERDRGTPQGSAVSPVLANLFLHYAFDEWMARRFPAVSFERYVDGAVVHCRGEREAQMLLSAISKRTEQVGLRLHPDKTRIVHCKDGKRQGSFEHTAFDFFGFTFRARAVRSRQGTVFTGFGPAVSKTAIRKMSEEDERGGVVLEAAPPHLPLRAGPHTMAQPDRVGVDELLRPLLPVGAVSAAQAHQRLPGALDEEEVQTAEDLQQSARRMEAHDPPVPALPRALEMGPVVLTVRLRRAR